VLGPFKSSETSACGFRRGRCELGSYQERRTQFMSSKELAKRTRRGPKTPEGRLAVRLNASTHGILSPQPIVTAYEKPEEWESHRAAIVDSLSPEGGMEQVLAERVALMSWRLNRVTLYEAEKLQEGQEDVLEDVRRDRVHKGRLEAIYEGRNPDALGVLIEAHPANGLEDLEMARVLYKHVCRLFDESKAGVRIEGGWGGSILDLAAREAITMADLNAGVEGATERDVRERAEKLVDALPGIPEDVFLDDVEFTVGQLKGLVEGLAREAGIAPETGRVDGGVVSPEERLLERVRSEARYEVVRLEDEAEEVQAQILKKRRERVLLDEADLQRISRSEAHLSRQMYQALHELEALQTRRHGKAAPLARLDVQT
jgi:hypothetical protein